MGDRVGHIGVGVGVGIGVSGVVEGRVSVVMVFEAGGAVILCVVVGGGALRVVVVLAVAVAVAVAVWKGQSCCCHRQGHTEIYG